MPKGDWLGEFEVCVLLSVAQLGDEAYGLRVRQHLETLTGRQMALIAASVNGLNLSKWQKSVNGSAVKTIASDVDKLATQAKVQGTPTVLVGCAGDNLQNVTSPTLEPTLQQTQQAIAAAACTK